MLMWNLDGFCDSIDYIVLLLFDDCSWNTSLYNSWNSYVLSSFNWHINPDGNFTFLFSWILNIDNVSLLLLNGMWFSDDLCFALFFVEAFFFSRVSSIRRSARDRGASKNINIPVNLFILIHGHINFSIADFLDGVDDMLNFCLELLLFFVYGHSFWNYIIDCCWYKVEDCDFNISSFSSNNLFFDFLVNKLSDSSLDISEPSSGDFVSDNSWLLSGFLFADGVVDSAWSNSVLSFGEIFVLSFDNIVVDSPLSFLDSCFIELVNISDWSLEALCNCLLVSKDASDEEGRCESEFHVVRLSIINF